MKIDANDPRWTAYVLGELEDPRDVSEIEAALAESPEARRLIEEIRESAQMLARELQAEPAAGLDAARRKRILTSSGANPGWFGLRPSRVFAGLAAAAAVLLAVFAGMQVLKQKPEIQQEAAPPAPVAASPSFPGAMPESSVRAVKQATIEDSPSRSERTAARQMETPASRMADTRSHLPETISAQPRPAIEALTSVRMPDSGTPDSVAKALSAGVVPIAELAAMIPGQETISAQPRSQMQSHSSPLPPGSATLSGVVKDPSGGVIPGAAIVARNDATGATYSTVTSRYGGFSLPGLRPGKHSVTASMPGFIQAQVKDVMIKENVPTNVEVTMKVGVVNETVIVQAGAYPVQSTSATIALQAERNAGRISDAKSNLGYKGINDTVKMPRIRRQDAGFNTEAYDYVVDNPFLNVAENPLSTFSIDVDTASYSNVRRFLTSGSLPPKDAVRIEEMINYFDYAYPGPVDGKPFAAHLEVAGAPWNPEHRLLRIGLKGRELRAERPPANLVFLLDVSGSMEPENKLPLAKDSMRLLIDQLRDNDSVAIVVYAGASGLVLPPTRGSQKGQIRDALEQLHAGGVTNGASGIQLAYQTAESNFIRGGLNRVILATDGDFNVGITSRGDLTRLIEEKAKRGIFLTVLGFGMGNYKDSTLELLADKGNGNYAYVDTLTEARKVLVEQLDSTLVTIAKDVKIQIEFNPAEVSAYRLIGYENRILAREDFNDDTKDAGEIGAGHAVTALYELVPAGALPPDAKVDPLKYQQPVRPAPASGSGELLTLKIRYKEPEGDKSSLMQYVVRDMRGNFSEASADFRFAAAVAGFGMMLRDSPYKGSATLGNVLEWARQGIEGDRYGYRQEFLQLVTRAMTIPR